MVKRFFPDDIIAAAEASRQVVQSVEEATRGFDMSAVDIPSLRDRLIEHESGGYLFFYAEPDTTELSNSRQLPELIPLRPRSPYRRLIVRTVGLVAVYATNGNHPRATDATYADYDSYILSIVRGEADSALEGLGVIVRHRESQPPAILNALAANQLNERVRNIAELDKPPTNNDNTP